jgi:hypothetical protein
MMTELFGLRKIAPLVRSYALPESRFDAHGEWHHGYGMFLLPSLRFKPVGRFSIKRSRVSSKTFQLDMMTQRDALSGYSHYTRANMICANNALSSPLQWSFEVKTAKNEQAPAYLHTGMIKSAVYKDKTIRYQTGRFSSTVPAPNSFACKTALFDAVQRLSTQTGPLQFDYMDEYDELSTDHTLRYKGTYDVQMKNGMKPLSCFIETGSGNTPLSYWRDSSGRLLFWISGIQVIVLTEQNGKRISCDLKGDVVQRAQKETEDVR